MSCCVAYLCQSSLRYVYATNSEASYTHVLSRPSDCREVRIAQIASSAACDGRILLCVSVYTRLDLVAFQRLHIAGLDRHTVGELHAVVICCRVSLSPVVLVISTLETRSQSASSLSRR